MKRLTFLIYLALICSAIQLNAQGIKAYLALGTNLTEANLTESGNSQVGTRLGLNMGPGVSFRLNIRWETSLELLYSKNGYYINIVEIPTTALDKITLHYVEMPFTLAYSFSLKKSGQQHAYHSSISGGITYAYLFNHKIIAIDGTNLTNEVRFDQKSALLFNLGATFRLSESFAINGRGTLSTFGKWTFALRLLYYI